VPSAHDGQAKALGQPEGAVHVLHGVARAALDQVVDGATRHDEARLKVDIHGDLGAVAAAHDAGVGFGDEVDEGRFGVGGRVGGLDLLGGDAGLEGQVHRGQEAAVLRHEVRREADGAR
jgi:hypothetical protein